MPTEQPSQHRPRGIYLLPNLFTAAALFAGFYAVVSAMNHHFEPAAVAIFIAMVLDSLDGRVARATQTQTPFGAEFDSLSDMVSFGVAPALVAYEWGLTSLGKIGWGAAFLYTAMAALRLARFNTQIGIADKRYFQGLPSPAAAAVVAGLVWVSTDLEMTGEDLRIPCLVLTVLSGLLMVSNIRFNSFKELDLRGKIPFVMMLAVILAIVLISVHPPYVLFASFVAYAISGPILTVVFRRKRRASRRRANKKAPELK